MKAKVDYMYHPGDVVRVREDLAENTNYKMCSGKIMALIVGFGAG